MIGLFMATVLVGCATTVFEGYQPDGRYCFRISKRKVCTADPAPTVDAEAKAKQFEPLADRTIVWIVSNAPLDPYGKVTVKVHGLEVVMLPHAVARAVLPPGPIRLDAVVGSRDVDVLTIVGKPGEQLFVEVYADVGLFATYFSLHRTHARLHDHAQDRCHAGFHPFRKAAPAR